VRDGADRRRAIACETARLAAARSRARRRGAGKEGAVAAAQAFGSAGGLWHPRRLVASLVDPYRLVGKQIADKYTVEAVIDRGGYGLVYRAFHEVLRVPVALKFFTGLAQVEDDQRELLLERFAQEGALLTSLSTRSANIVQARDMGTLTTEDGTRLPFLVLEWLEGSSLERLLHSRESPERGKSRGWREAFELLDGVARALAIAHAGGVAHRDIKPGNFFALGQDLRPGVVVKLLDFGIAKVMPADLSLTGAAGSDFTPKYGAPEQFDRRHGATGPWTDVFGFALVMLELMRGGTRVFGQKEFVTLALAVQDPASRPTPRTLGITTSDAVEAVFARALAIPVSERYEHMAAFWTALAAALEVHDFRPISAEPWGTGLGGDLRPGTSQRARIVDVSLRDPGVGGVLAAGPATSQPGVTSMALGTDASPRGRSPRYALSLGVGAIGVVALVLMVMTRASESAPSESAPTGSEPAAAAAPSPVAAPAPPPRCPEGMVLIAGGKFFMGSDNVDNRALASARPAHQVKVADFCLDLREVTVAEHEACSTRGECKRAFRDSMWPQGGTGRKAWEEARAAYSPLCNTGQAGRESHPVNCVTWEQAAGYCERAGKRLPGEAEWEFAARGSDGRAYPWGDEVPDARHLNGCGQECATWRKGAGLPEVPLLYASDDGHPGTAPVGSFPAGKTQAGLLDMVGNVFEWTADDFRPYPGAPADTPAPAGMKVIRGGAFNSSQAEHAEPALRFPQDATAHVHAVGFRCAADPRPG
jgi:formylglycine-generating enzyme required for sulfatase activity/serine/threonine protein kinase